MSVAEKDLELSLRVRLWQDQIKQLLEYFRYDHLSPVLSVEFSDLAHSVARKLPAHPETAVMLRKLLEAKDCAVRAALTEHDKAAPSEEDTDLIFEECTNCGGLGKIPEHSRSLSEKAK